MHRVFQVVVSLVSLVVSLSISERVLAQQQPLEEPGAEGLSSPSPAGVAVQQPVPPPVPPPPSQPKGPRIELALIGSGHGAIAGALLCGAIGCTARGFAGASLLGAGAAAAAIGVSVRARGLSESTAQAIEGGALWGSITPLYIDAITTGFLGDRGLMAGIVAGQLVGAGVGVTLERTLSLSSGSVALANSGALWLPAIVMLPQVTFGRSHTDAEGYNDMSVKAIAVLGGTLIASEVVGLSLGGYLGQRANPARWQVFMGDVGAGIGGGLFALTAWLVRGEGVHRGAYGLATATGMGVGFAGGYLLATLIPRRRGPDRVSRSWGGRWPSLAALPVRGGGQLTLSGRW